MIFPENIKVTKVIHKDTWEECYCIPNGRSYFYIEVDLVNSFPSWKLKKILEDNI